jgi:hypothetical protein
MDCRGGEAGSRNQSSPVQGLRGLHGFLPFRLHRLERLHERRGGLTDHGIGSELVTINDKFQAPNPKLQTISNDQNSKLGYDCFEFRDWDFEFIWNLKFGIWDFFLWPINSQL